MFAWIAPFIGVGIFFFLERYCFKVENKTKRRVSTILSIQVATIFTNLALSLFFLVPLVFLLAPLQIYSFSKLNVPILISFTFSFLFLDLVNYLNHYLHHKVPLLWRFHRLHHSDCKIDSLTTFLHHPFELVSTFFVTIALATIFDVPVIVLITYGLIVGFHAAFTHLNILLPERVAKILNFLVVTPNFHKIHHSTNIKEGNANFGIMFIYWDYLFCTTIRKCNYDLIAMNTGIDISQSPKKISVLTFLTNPFK